MSAEVRLCLQCRSHISSMRRGKFCNRECRDLYAKLVRLGGKEIGIRKRECAAVRTGFVLFHNCIPGGGAGLDPFFPELCRCRKTVTMEKAKILVARGEAIDFATRKPFFDDRAIAQVGKLLRTPRSASIEKSHVERSVGILKRAPRRKRVRNLEELQAAIAVDKQWREEEEQIRMEHYQFLTVQSMRIVQIPADEYDEMMRNDPWQGRCPWESGIGIADDRSSVSKDISVPRDFLLLESDVLTEEEDIKVDQPEETESEDGDLTIVTEEELHEVTT
jgi:hypothetical protein